MKVRIEPARLAGEIAAVPSKSEAHRNLICAALSDGPTELMLSRRCEDVDATLACLSAMGAKVETQQELCRLWPLERGRSEVKLDCRESGSTLRFLLPTAAVVCESAVFTGGARLSGRPLKQLTDVLQEHGANIRRQEHRAGMPQNTECLKPENIEVPSLPMKVMGGLKSGVYLLPGNISSQYISGLLFALPLLSGDSRIEITTELESQAYVDMTIEVLHRYGIGVERGYGQGKKGPWFFIQGNQKYKTPGIAKIEGDWSAAAFFLAAGAAGGRVACKGLNLASTQGDKAVLNILADLGASVKVKREKAEGEGNVAENTVEVSEGSLRGREIDVRQIPDLMPVLAVTACMAKGKTVFQNAARLRTKESDRLHSTAELINALGGRAEEGTDSLTVYGTAGLIGGEADSFGDHRIAMAAAVAAQMCREPVVILGAEAVNKSYPEFYRDYNSLGGGADVI